jgi:hypothetical protein
MTCTAGFSFTNGLINQAITFAESKMMPTGRQLALISVSLW